MAITPQELNELTDTHFAVHHVCCFGTSDIMREMVLINRATDAQLLKVCTAHYQAIL